MGVAMSFYVFHSVLPEHTRLRSGQIRIHKGECLHCRRGGTHKKRPDDDSELTGWSRGFESLAEARAYMNRQFGDINDKGLCKYCLRSA